jgi:hypothetical protein
VGQLPIELIGCALAWHRDGAGWVLQLKRRRMGRVIPDSEYPGMWRSVKSRGQLSDMANLSWAKNAVLLSADRELAWEGRKRRAITPPKVQQIEPVFDSGTPLVRYSESMAASLPSSR